MNRCKNADYGTICSAADGSDGVEHSHCDFEELRSEDLSGGTYTTKPSEVSKFWRYHKSHLHQTDAKNDSVCCLPLGSETAGEFISTQTNVKLLFLSQAWYKPEL